MTSRAIGIPYAGEVGSPTDENLAVANKRKHNQPANLVGWECYLNQTQTI